MKELNRFKINAQSEGFSPDLSFHEVSLQPPHGSRLYSQQEGGALGLEQLRALQVHLMDLHRVKPFKRVLITSAVRGEGKTHVAANLSLSLAAEGFRRVLVIDTDVRNPSLHLALGITNLFGFKDCLASENKCWNAVQKVKDFELYVITGGIGSCSSIGPARIASVQVLLDQLEPFFDLIIMDSPPLLGGVDGKLLSNVADSILVVVGSGKAPRRLVMEAQQLLPKEKILGGVLNRLDANMACFRSYSEYGSTGSEAGANNNNNKEARPKKKSQRGKTYDLEPDVPKEAPVIPITVHEEATSEQPIPSVPSQCATPPIETGPKMAVDERRYESVTAPPPAPSVMQEHRVDAAARQSTQQDEAPSREFPGLAAQDVPQKKRFPPQDYLMTALLVAVLSLAGILGWVLGQHGARHYRRPGSPAKQSTSVQSAAPFRSEIVASALMPPVAFASAPSSTQPTAVSAAPALKPSNVASQGTVVYDDKNVVIRSATQSQGNSTAGNAGTTTGQTSASARTTLRISSGIAREYLALEVAPRYPEPAREGHIQGPVVLHVLVDKNGRVQKLTKISGNALLAAAATEGVQQWRFRPFYHNGQAEEFETQVTVNFKLPHP